MPVLEDAIGNQLNQYPGGAYSGATISRAPWTDRLPDLPPWLSGAIQVAQLPQQAFSAIAQPMYRTMFSGTPWTLGTAPSWVQHYLPGLAGLDRTGQPLWGRQTMQRAGNVAADVGGGVLASYVAPERLLGLPRWEEYVLGKGKQAADQLRREGVAATTAAGEGSEWLQQVRQARREMAAERAMREAGGPLEEQGRRAARDFINRYDWSGRPTSRPTGPLPAPPSMPDVIEGQFKSLAPDPYGNQRTAQNAALYRQLSRQLLGQTLMQMHMRQQQQAGR